MELKVRLNGGDMGNVLIVILRAFPGGSASHLAYRAGWGYYPSGGLGLVLLIVLILLLMGRI
jgi:hypothetical protein